MSLMVQLLSFSKCLFKPFMTQALEIKLHPLLSDAPSDAFLVFINSDRDASPASSGGVAGICVGK